MARILVLTGIFAVVRLSWDPSIHLDLPFFVASNQQYSYNDTFPTLFIDDILQ